MFIGGSVTASGDLVIEAGAPVNLDIDDDDPIYTLYNKAAYFADIAKVDADHYLLQQQDFSLLVTGTITTLADAAALSLSATNDVIIRGNINVNGVNGSLQVQSDTWVYIEGFITVQNRITVLGGLTVNGVDLGGADLKGNSVHVHATSQLRTTQAGSLIDIRGAKDVEIYGALIAAGEVDASGAQPTHPDGEIRINAGELVFIDGTLFASKSIVVNGGPGLDSYALIDLSDAAATDLSTFSVAVNQLPLAPIDVSAAQSSAELVALLNADAAFERGRIGCRVECGRAAHYPVRCHRRRHQCHRRQVLGHAGIADRSAGRGGWYDFRRESINCGCERSGSN